MYEQEVQLLVSRYKIAPLIKRPKLPVFLSICGLVLVSLFSGQWLRAQQSFYDFTVEDIHGQEFDLAQLQGKKVLVVNTASKCALTPQYEALERLYRTYGEEDFIILAFPSNDFGHQEPGSNNDIDAFCTAEYGISFPLMAKIIVKGEEMHPLYRWLTKASENGVEESRVSWNFQKYMIDKGGRLVGHAPPWRKPESKEIVTWITEE